MKEDGITDILKFGIAFSGKRVSVTKKGIELADFRKSKSSIIEMNIHM